MRKLLALLLLFSLTTSVIHAAFTTDGTSNFWKVANGSALDDPDGEWTWAFMWRQDGAIVANASIMANAISTTSNPGMYFSCRITSGPGNIRLDHNDASADHSTATSSQECLTTGVWRRVVARRITNDLEIYLDGSLVAATSGAGVGSLTSPADLFIGDDADNNAKNAQSICDVGHWLRAVSTDEITGLSYTSVKMFPQSLALFVPAVNNFIEEIAGLTVTNSSATIEDCPRLFRPN